jgi:LPXTG-site transpeptidase (sortase) family protein
MRRVGSLLGIVGLLILGWVGWTMYGPGGEPITNFLQGREQAALQSQLSHEKARHPGLSCVRAREGHAVGVLRIPAIGVRQVVVEGTGHDDLERGPGHYPGTGLPGDGGTIAIAGHRTTWGAPFRHLDSLRHGDRITLCGASYRVQTVIVVPATDWRVVLAHRPVETLLLSACHPLYSAAERIIVLATRSPL